MGHTVVVEGVLTIFEPDEMKFGVSLTLQINGYFWSSMSAYIGNELYRMYLNERSKKI